MRAMEVTTAAREDVRRLLAQLEREGAVITGRPSAQFWHAFWAAADRLPMRELFPVFEALGRPALAGRLARSAQTFGQVPAPRVSAQACDSPACALVPLSWDTLRDQAKALSSSTRVSR
jgi:hypothetical protein